jgi:SPP1 gp7 family putative phage head morphogenesis protein
MLKAIEKGYGVPFAEIEYGHKDWYYIQNLKYNTAVFDAFKLNRQGKDLRKLLTDGDKILSWKEFQEAASPITSAYNQIWLQTEFNHAHQCANMARKWREFEDNANFYPNLEFVAVMDERTRESHAALNGLIYPINHSFWDTYYPPLDWGCRCTVMATDDNPSNRLPEKLPDVADGMKINTGKTAKIFDDTHPYFKSANKIEKEEILSFVHQYIRPASDIEKAFKAYNSYGKKWEKAYFNGNNGGYIVIDKKAFKPELIENKYIGKILATKGNQVELLKRNEISGVKSIDSKTNGKYNEFKSVSSKTSVDNQLRDANIKAKNLNIKTDVTLYSNHIHKGDLLNAISDRLPRCNNIRNIYIIIDDEIYMYNKNTKGMNYIP